MIPCKMCCHVDTHGTGHARLRQPSYRGLREDLSPDDLRDQS